MVTFKSLNCLLNIFKLKRTNNESLTEPKKLSRLSFSRIWRRISSSGARETGANESTTTTTKSSRSSFFSRLFHRRKQLSRAGSGDPTLSADESSDERDMASNSDDRPLSVDDEALSASVTISSSLTTITETTVSDGDNVHERESRNEDVPLEQQTPWVASEMADSAAITIVADRIKGRIDKIDHMLDKMRKTYLSYSNVHCDLTGDGDVASTAQLKVAHLDYSWLYRIWIPAVCVVFVLLLLL